MSRLEAKLKEARRLHKEAEAIFDADEVTPERLKEGQTLLEQLEKVKGEIKSLRAVEDAGRVLAQITEGTLKEQDGFPEEWKSWGEFLRASYNFSRGLQSDDRLRWFDDEQNKAVELKDIVEGVGASGGFLVPAEFRAELYAVMAEESTVRQRATVIPMTRNILQVPVLDQTDTTAGQPAWYGGMQFYWQGEATQKQQSDPRFRRVKLVAHKLIGYTVASDEMVADSAISLEGFLSGPRGFAGGASWMEEYAFLRGTGVDQPLGVLNAGATYAHPRAADGEITYDDVANMVAHFLPTGQGVWYINIAAMPQIITMNGPSGNPSYVWNPNAADGIPGTLLGYPVIWTEKLPALGSPGDALLADWSYYLVGDRQATTVESTDKDRWRFDETSWRMVHRVGGQPWLSAPITLADGSHEISPFVILGEKSS